jgi:hypothetical protein
MTLGQPCLDAPKKQSANRRPCGQTFTSRAQQSARGLRADTIDYRERLVRRFVSFTNEFPWRWGPGHVDEWTLTLTAENHLAPMPRSQS